MSIAEKTGWTKDEILHDYSFAELSYMLADAPRLIKKKNKASEFQSDEEIAEWFGV